MNKMHDFRPSARRLLAALMIGALAGCATTDLAQTPLAPSASPTPANAEPANTGPANTGPANASRVEKMAAALVRADEADLAGDKEGLSRAVRLIDGLGARPLAETGSDPLPNWREQTYGTQIPLRGRPLGPGYRKGTLSAGETERIEQLFLSGQRANVALSGPGKATLELKIEDAKSGEVCGRATSPFHCDWVPIYTQRYVIEISNPGEEQAHYFLVVE